MSESLYFIAVVPPEEVEQQLFKLKLEVEEKFNSKHAQNAPAHITLHMPFRWKDSKRDILLEMMKMINQTVQPVSVELNGFDFFEPRVVFVNVLMNERLAELQKNVQQICRLTLKKVNANYRDLVFHPHVTIGFRDLKKAQFYEAREYYSCQDFKAVFEVSEVSLLKHDGAKWHVEERQ
jgi:2'-5' RNA ligase